MSTTPKSPATLADQRAVVVGAGLAGLVAAIGLTRVVRQTTLVTFGLGGLQLSQGTIDLLGYSGDEHHTLIPRPFEALEDLPAEHPYRVVGAEAVQAGLDLLNEVLGEGVLVGDGQTNALYPTAVGALRPTALVPASMAAGRCEPGKKFLIIGVRELKDFHPDLIAGNINRTPLPDGDPIACRTASFSLPAREGEVDANPVIYARAMDRPEFRRRFAEQVKALVRPGETVGVPAVLGLNDPAVHREVEQIVGAPVFEIVSQPPSVPGMRLNQALMAAARAAGVRLVMGSKVQGLVTAGGQVSGVTLTTAGRTRTIPAEVVVHCPGGFESGALAVDSYNVISETVFNLPVSATDATELIHGDYWGKPQGLFRVGVRTDEAMRPLDATGALVHPNLFAAGGVLAGAIRWEEKSGEGISLGSAMKAVAAISEGANR